MVGIGVLYYNNRCSERVIPGAIMSEHCVGHCMAYRSQTLPLSSFCPQSSDLQVSSKGQYIHKIVIYICHKMDPVPKYDLETLLNLHFSI